MQKISTKPQTQSIYYHTRYWKMEVLRGVVSVAFSILLFFLTRSTFAIVNHLMSVYLFIDGSLDIYKVIRGRRNLSNYLFGIVSIVLGTFNLLFFSAISFLIVTIIAVHIFMRGTSVLIDARQSQHTYEGFTWLLGTLFILFAILLLFKTNIQYFTLGLIILFLILYTFIDGLYLLIRGLLLHFRPTFFAASIAEAPESLLDLPEIFPSTTRRAIIFVRHSGANGFGHISWAFEWTNGWFNVGSVENKDSRPFVAPPEMGFWSAHTLSPIETIQKQFKLYDEYKIFYVTHPHPKEAWKTMIWESRQPYTFLHQNCIDVTYDILRAYGIPDLIDPAEGPVPNEWYDALPGRGYSIEENPTIPVHLYKISKHKLTTHEIMLTIPSRIKGTPPPWRVNGWRAWQELNFLVDKILRDMTTLFVSIGHLAAKAISACRR